MHTSKHFQIKYVFSKQTINSSKQDTYMIFTNVLDAIRAVTNCNADIIVCSNVSDLIGVNFDGLGFWNVPYKSVKKKKQKNLTI